MALEGWPTRANAEREEKIIDAIKAGNYELAWCPLELSDGVGTLHLMVSCDALKIDGVRVTGSALMQQRIADEIGAVLLTPKLYDQIWLKTAPRNRLTPHPLGEPRTSTARMIEHSKLVDDEIAAKGSSGLISNQGKIWAITKAIFTQSARAEHKAANYGWISPDGGVSQSTPSLKVIQQIGTRHDTNPDVDYSQIILLAHRSAKFGELPVDMIDVYTGDSPGNALVSHEGPLPDWRQPGGPLGGENLVPPRGQPPPPPPTGTSARRKSGSAAPIVGVGLGAGTGAAIGGVGGAVIGGAVGGILGLLVRRR